MREHERRRLEVERETGHPFRETKTDAVRSLVDPTYAADLENRRTADLPESNDANEIASEIRTASEEFRSRDPNLAQLMRRAARKLEDLARIAEQRAAEQRFSQEVRREAQETIDLLIDRERAFRDIRIDMYRACLDSNVPAINALLTTARRLEPRIVENRFTSHRFDKDGYIE